MSQIIYHSFDHAKVCPFYETKWKDEFNADEDLIAEYIMLLNRERINKFRMPIL